MSFSKYHYPSHFFHHVLEKDLNKITLTHIIKEFVVSFIAIFIPFFLIEKGYSILEILIFEVIFLGSAIYFTYLGLSLINSIGIKKVISLGFVFTILFYLTMSNYDFLSNLLGRIFILIIIAILLVLGEAFYWMGMHSEFANNLDKKREGSEIGIINLFAVWSRAIAPLIGALIVVKYSFETSFALVAFLLLIAVVPLFRTKDKKVKSSLSIKVPFNKNIFRKYSIFILEGFNSIALGFMWPFMLFIIKFSLVSIASLYFVMNLFYSLAFYLSGKLTDKYGEKKVMEFGSWGAGISMILRAAYMNPIGIALFQGMGASTVPFFFTPIQKYFYQLAKVGKLQAIYNREFYLAIGRIIGFLLLIVLILMFEPIIAFMIGFVIFALTTIAISPVYSKYCCD